MKKITPFLWFDDQAEAAMEFYVSIFDNSKIINIDRAGDPKPGPKGEVRAATLLLDGQEFMIINGGPLFHFTPAISMFVSCDTQTEVDRLWERLSVGGKPGQCGWLQDKYGLSWQIIPTALGVMLRDRDAAAAERVRQAMLKMTKIDIKGLQRAYGLPRSTD